MEIIFYKSTYEPASFPKTFAEGTGYSVTGTLRSECDVQNPVIEFVGFNQYIEYNYAYIPEWKRWYFITEATSVSNEILEMYFHVDVLNTYATEILNHEAFLNRCSNIYNPYIIDELVPLYPAQEEIKYSLTTIYGFRLTNDFEDESFIFSVAGINQVF